MISADAILGAIVTIGLAALLGFWKLATMLAEVRGQVRPNGGSTLKDDAKIAATEAVAARQLAEHVAAELVTFRAHQSDDTAANRVALGKVQHDLTNVRAGQEMLLEQQLGQADRITRHNARNAEHVLELRRAVAEVSRESAARDKALGDALSESLDVAIVAADAADPPSTGG